jgi:hypothetical protein
MPFNKNPSETRWFHSVISAKAEIRGVDWEIFLFKNKTKTIYNNLKLKSFDSNLKNSFSETLQVILKIYNRLHKLAFCL